MNRKRLKKAVRADEIPFGAKPTRKKPERAKSKSKRRKRFDSLEPETEAPNSYTNTVQKDSPSSHSSSDEVTEEEEPYVDDESNRKRLKKAVRMDDIPFLGSPTSEKPKKAKDKSKRRKRFASPEPETDVQQESTPSYSSSDEVSEEEETGEDDESYERIRTGKRKRRGKYVKVTAEQTRDTKFQTFISSAKSAIQSQVAPIFKMVLNQSRDWPQMDRNGDRLTLINDLVLELGAILSSKPEYGFGELVKASFDSVVKSLQTFGEVLTILYPVTPVLAGKHLRWNG